MRQKDQIKRRAAAAVLALTAVSFSMANGDDIPRVVRFEIVTENAATGDGGNAWGGHQGRIVRTAAGVFTTYTVAGDGPKSRQWRLAWRQKDRWKVVARGIAGKDPVNLLATPEGTLYIVGWPAGKGTLWSGKPKNGQVEIESQPIPGVAVGHWPYASAGVDRRGNLCVLSSEGDKPGAFRWAMYDAASKTWRTHKSPLDYRHCYTYVFPQPDGSLSLVSTRDVTWETLGYRKPVGAFDYAFNAWSYFHTDRAGTRPLLRIASAEEKPTERFPYAFCNAQNDAHLDTRGRMHVLYRRTGNSTGGSEVRRQAIFSTAGKKLHDGKLPQQAGKYCRIFQDDRGRFYLLGSAGVIFSSRDGMTWSPPRQLNLRRHQVEYSGYAIAVPRTGTPAANFVDAVFPSGGGRK